MVSGNLLPSSVTHAESDRLGGRPHPNYPVKGLHVLLAADETCGQGQRGGRSFISVLQIGVDRLQVGSWISFKMWHAFRGKIKNIIVIAWRSYLTIHVPTCTVQV